MYKIVSVMIISWATGLVTGHTLGLEKVWYNSLLIIPAVLFGLKIGIDVYNEIHKPLTRDSMPQEKTSASKSRHTTLGIH